MKNVKAVTLVEAAMKFQNLAEHAPEHHERRLTVRLHSPGGLGGTPTVDVIGIHVGIDWDASKVILHTEQPLTKLTAEQVADITESVKKGQSWHAMEQYRQMRQRLDAANLMIEAMSRSLKAIVDGVGLPTYYPSREEAPTENLAELVLAKVKPALELLEGRTKQIAPVPVVRDARGIWRHPGYPQFETSERYNEWFREQSMTYTTTYLVAPDNDEELCDGDYSKWAVVPPNGTGWFLLAIEEFVDEPVCVWGHPLQGGGADA